MSAATLDPAIARYEERLDRADPARVAAFERFVELGGFPGPHDESWRQTPLKGITGGDWSPTPFADEAAWVAAGQAAYETWGSTDWANPWVFANGGLSLFSSANAPAAHWLGLAQDAGPFVALNRALAPTHGWLEIGAGTTLDRPIHLVFFHLPGDGPTDVHEGAQIRVGNNATCTILESHITIGDVPTFSTHVTEIAVGDGAQVEHTVWQQLGPQAQHVAITQAELGRNARVTFNGFTDGGAMVRNEVRARFTQPGAECDMNGLYLGSGDSVIDYHTQVDHATTDSSSRQLYKGVLADRARGVFEGHVIIRPDSERTNATQSNRNLLLTDGAGVHTKPLLEIYNDDVQCAHGAAIGQLDDEALFYLRQRGIPFAAARRMLAESFVADVVERVQNEAVREWLKPRVLAALPLGAAQ